MTIKTAIKIPITFEHQGKTYTGIFSKVSGSGSTALFHLMIDDFIRGRCLMQQNGAILTQTHLYVGNCEAVPVNKKGNPVPGLFPYKNTHNNITSFTYQVPISAIGMNNCGCVAAHAAVVKLDSNGNVIDSQTAWGAGTTITPGNGNWGTKFEYCTCSGGQ